MAAAESPATWHKSWAILNREQRRGAAWLFVLSVGGMLFETLGVGLVLPAFALLADNNVAARYPALAPFLAAIGSPTRTQLIVLGMLALVAVYFCKEVYLALLAWCQMRFVYGVQAELSRRLYQRYLSQPYPFHLRRNSAQLIRNAITETNIFAQVVLTAGLQCLTEALIGTGIALLMLSVEPLGTLLVVGLSSVAVGVFHRMTSRRISAWGAIRQQHEGTRIQQIQQGLGGIKEVKMLGREDVFLDAFDAGNAAYAAAGRRFGFISQLPRLWLEFLGIASLATLVLAMVSAGRPPDAVLSTLGLFAVGAFRLMPSANRVLSGMQSVRFGLPVVDVLYTELLELPGAPVGRDRAPLSLAANIRLDDVTFRYPGAVAPAVDGASLTIPRGSSVGFVGTTGAGKTTLIDIVLGLLPPSSGRVLVDGVDIASNLAGWQEQIGYVPQSIYLSDDSLLHNIAFGVPPHEIDRAALARAVGLAQLRTFVEQLPEGLDTYVGERGVRLSGGQRQRIGIARALYRNPSVLVLDEATSALDVATEAEVLDAVRALHGVQTVLIVAHRRNAVANCDHVFRVDDGRLSEETAPVALAR
jgi:ABC-type multidrug transport system fused ATPase/permease subunit